MRRLVEDGFGDVSVDFDVGVAGCPHGRERNPASLQLVAHLLLPLLTLWILSRTPHSHNLQRGLPSSHPLGSQANPSVFQPVFLFLQVFKAAQPALLYLVPFTLIPLFGMAWMKVDFLTIKHINYHREIHGDRKNLNPYCFGKNVSKQFPLQGDLRSMWSDPFVHVPPAKYQAI